MRHGQLVVAILLSFHVFASDALAQSISTPAPRVTSARWRQIRTPDFTVSGTAPDGALKDVASSIVTFRTAFARLFPDARLNGPVPTNIVVIDGFDEFRRYQLKDSRGQRMMIGGYFSSRADENLLVFPYGAQYEVAFHEYTHYLVRLNMRGAVPGWLNEGLAEFYSTFIPDYQGKSLVGAPPATRIRTLREAPYMPLRDLVSPTDMESLWRSSRISSYYAEAWALVHYVAVGRKNPVAAPIDIYLRTLAATNSQDQAFMAAFGVGVDDMNLELREYVRRFSFQALTFPKNVADGPGFVVERAPEVVARRMEAALLLAANESDEADMAVQRGVTAEPRDIDARVMQGRVRMSQERNDAAITLLSELTTDAPKAFAPQYYLGRALQKESRHEDALAAFVRATEASTTNPYAWMGVSEAALALGRDAQANATFQRAMQIEASAQFARSYAQTAFGFGRDEVAVAATRRYLDEVGLADTSGQYASMIGAIADMRLGKTEDARVLLMAAEAAARSGTWTVTVLRFLQGKLTPKQFMDKAGDVGERTEAHTYTGLLDEIAGRRDEALAHFRWVVAQGAKNYTEYSIAQTTLQRLEHATPEAR